MLFAPRCPVDLREKVWTERRLTWLVREYGLQRLLDATFVEPEMEFFANVKTNDEAGAEEILTHLCEYFHLPRNNYRLSFVSSNSTGVPLQDFRGGDARTEIQLDLARLNNLVSAISVISSQLARDVVFLGDDSRLPPNAQDAWSVADLFGVLSGMGVIQALSPVSGQGPNVTWENVTIRRQGTLPVRITGYALALCAMAREEWKPVWERSLVGEGRAAFRAGLKFLRKTKDSVFQQELTERKSPDEVVEILRNGTPSQRLNEMLEIQAAGVTDDLAMPLAETLFDREPFLVSEALRTLRDIGPSAAAAALEKVLDLFYSQQTEVRTTAFVTATALQPDPAADTGMGLTMPERIGACLKEGNPSIVHSALAALSNYGVAAASVAPMIVPQLSVAARNCDYPTLGAFLNALTPIVPSVQEFLVEHTGRLDPEIREQIEFQFHALNDDDGENAE